MVGNPERDRSTISIYFNAEFVFGSWIKRCKPAFLIQHFPLELKLVAGVVKDFKFGTVFGPYTNETFGFAQVVSRLIDQRFVLGEGHEADKHKNQGMNCTHWVKKAPIKHCRALPGT